MLILILFGVWFEADLYHHQKGEEENDRSLTDDVSEAAVHYAKSARDTVKDVAGAAKKAAQAFTDAFKEHDKS